MRPKKTQDIREETTEISFRRVLSIRPELAIELLLIAWSVILGFYATVFSSFDIKPGNIINEVLAGIGIYLLARGFSLISRTLGISTHWIFWPVSVAAAVWLTFFWVQPMCKAGVPTGLS